MDNHEFEDLGKKIQDIVDNAVNSNSYHELSHTINQTVNKAIDSGSEALKNALNSVFDPGAYPEFRKKSYTYQSPYYGRSRKAKQQAVRKQSELLYGKTFKWHGAWSHGASDLDGHWTQRCTCSRCAWSDVCRRSRWRCSFGSRNKPSRKTGTFPEIYPCAGSPHLL